MAPNLPRLQRQSRTRSHLSRNHSENTHTEASLNKKKRVEDTVKVVKTIQSLGLPVRDNINVIKAAGQSRATYGAVVDPFTVAQINTLRGKYTQALWPN
eukprot:4810002-Heterocapsa_arctica.AAC.1